MNLHGGKVNIFYEVTHYIYMKILILYIDVYLTNLPPFHPYL